MLLILLPAALAAELSLQEAVARSLMAPAGQVAVAEVAAQAAEARAAVAYDDNPLLTLEREPDRTRLSAELPLDLALPGRLVAADRSRELAHLRVAAARAAVGAAVGAAWLDARRALDHAKATSDLRAIARRSAEGARNRAEAGELAPDEATLLAAEAAAATARALVAEAEAAAAIRRLEVLIGEEPDGSTVLGPWAAIPDPPALDPAVLPAVLAADAEARAALARSHLAALERLPRLILIGGLERAEVESGPVYGGELEIPLFAPRVAAHQAARASAEAATGSAALTRLDGSARLDAARRELAAATELQSAWEGLDLVAALEATARRFEAGELAPGELLARRALLADARDEGIDARWRIERARLALWEIAGRTPWEGTP